MSRTSIQADILATELSPIEQQVDSILSPFVTAFSNIIFFPITIGGVSFPIVVAWLIIGALVFTIYTGSVSYTHLTLPTKA